MRYGKKKNKNKFLTKSLILLPLLIWAVFYLGKTSLANNTLKISRIQFSGGKGKADEDFIEIKNTTEKEINLKNYRLVKQTSSGKKYNLVSFRDKDFIAPRKTYLWVSSQEENFPKKIGAEIWTKEKISKGNGIAIMLGTLKNGIIIDSVNWKKDIKLKKELISKPKDYSGRIKINEIYPSPNTKAGETEFIEIKNISSEKINLKNWSASDSIHKGKSLKENIILEPNQFYVFQGKFYLNSSNDSAKVFDEKGNLVDSVSYGKGKSRYAYAFDGSTWRWTSYPTPGAKNKFDKILFGKIKKDKDVYQNIYAHFEVKSDKDVQKFTWDFGDGHKSYLKNTRHKYVKTGNYQASLRLRGNGEEHIYTFTIKVKKYKAPKIRIISFSPNPKGRDNKNEWIKIKNKSRKKVNLKNWFIATGWKKMYNHSIKKDFKIKSKQIKKLTRQDCAFSLNNTRSKIELKSPDKETVQKIKYQSKKNKIVEDEIYKKVKNQWTGIKPPIPKIKFPLKKKEDSAISPSLPIVKKKTTPSNYLPLDKKYFTARPQLRKNIYPIKLSTYADYATFIQTPATLLKGSVLGAQSIRSQSFYYFSTPTAPPKYWANKWAEFFWTKINSRLNQILYKISG